MSDSAIEVSKHFKGAFITKPEDIQQKLAKIKAYVFDWDGVFNNGQKDEHGSSPFNEVDAMGTNLLRFNHYLRTGFLPIVAVISGERNKAAFSLSDREHFHNVYCSIKYKPEALNHLCKAHNIKPDEVAFFFDDVLDLAVAAQAGVRVLVSRASNPLFLTYAVKKGYADYLTACSGTNSAVRESVELIMGLNGMYEETIEERMNFTEKYKHYLRLRNQTTPACYTIKDSIIVEDRRS
jgi:3-deoxy-D-manno-octulosonate 8-phosphate phosphatase (KDO 8-P phosphatase)